MSMPARKLEILKQKIGDFGRLVDGVVARAIEAVETPSAALPEELEIAYEDARGRYLEILESCQDFLSLHAPVTRDLRFILASLKVNEDLRRTVKNSISIARRSVSSAESMARLRAHAAFSPMTQMVRKIVHDSVSAFLALDKSAAEEIIKNEAVIDAYKTEMAKHLIALVREHAIEAEALLDLTAVLRKFERMSDHAADIAHDAVYVCTADWGFKKAAG